MSYKNKIFFYLIFSFCTVSGVGLGVLKYFFKQVTPYGLMTHPWQALFLDLHVLSITPVLILFGFLFSDHVLKYWKKERRARLIYSGWLVFWAFLLSAISGSLIQVHFFSNEISQMTHIVTSGLLILFLVFHITSKFYR